MTTLDYFTFAIQTTDNGQVGSIGSGILAFLLAKIDAAIEGMVGFDTFVSRMYAACFSLGILAIIYEVLIKKSGGMLNIIPQIIFSLIIYYIGVQYNHDVYGSGFIGFSTFLIIELFSLGFGLSPVTSEILNQPARIFSPGILAEYGITNLNQRTAPTAFFENPWLLALLGEQLSGRLQVPSVGILDIHLPFAALLTKAIVIISFWAMAVVIFLNIALFKFFSVIAMLMLPLILVPPFRQTGQAAINSLIAFLVKFVTYGMILTVVFVGITNLVDQINTIYTGNKTFSLDDMIYLCILSVMFAYFTLLIPAKIAQMFGGGIAFGDSQVTGFFNKAVLGSVGFAAAAAFSTGRTVLSTVGRATAKPGLTKLGSALLAKNPTSTLGHVATAIGAEMTGPGRYLAGRRSAAFGKSKYGDVRDAGTAIDNTAKMIGAGLGAQKVEAASRAAASFVGPQISAEQVATRKEEVRVADIEKRGEEMVKKFKASESRKASSSTQSSSSAPNDL